MIRFQRTGRTNDPAFRIVVSDKTRHPKSGKALQVVGSYNPKTKDAIIDAEAAKGWIAKGAQLSGTVHNLFLSKGIIEGKKINVRQTKVVKAEPVKEAVPLAEKAAVASPAPAA